jgi:hypothetical protein
MTVADRTSILINIYIYIYCESVPTLVKEKNKTSNNKLSNQVTFYLWSIIKLNSITYYNIPCYNTLLDYV